MDGIVIDKNNQTNQLLIRLTPSCGLIPYAAGYPKFNKIFPELSILQNINLLKATIKKMNKPSNRTVNEIDDQHRKSGSYFQLLEDKLCNVKNSFMPI